MMNNPVPSTQLNRAARRSTISNTLRLAMDEHELAMRWNLSVKSLRRWRQSGLGPTFIKLGSRVSYLIADVETFERRVSRNSTSTRAYA